MIETDNNNSPKLTQQEVIRLERDLAKFANMMDSVVRIPFTKQGVGADAALSTVPVAGDLAGFALTCYAIYKARQIGVPQSKLNPVIKLATMDWSVLFPWLEPSSIFLSVLAVRPWISCMIISVRNTRSTRIGMWYILFCMKN